MAPCLMYIYLYTRVHGCSQLNNAYQVVDCQLKAAIGNIPYDLKFTKKDLVKIKDETSVYVPLFKTQQTHAENNVPNEKDAETISFETTLSTRFSSTTKQQRMPSDKIIPMGNHNEKIKLEIIASKLFMSKQRKKHIANQVPTNKDIEKINLEIKVSNVSIRNQRRMRTSIKVPTAHRDEKIKFPIMLKQRNVHTDIKVPKETGTEKIKLGIEASDASISKPRQKPVDNKAPMDKDSNKIKSKIMVLNRTKSIRREEHSGESAPVQDRKAFKIDKLKHALKMKIVSKVSPPLLTLFTSWTDNREKYLVHNITTHNWLSLQPYVIPVIFTNEPEVANACRRMGWKVFPLRIAAAGGIPVLKYMYKDVMEAFNTTFYAYSNSDILFTDSLIDTLLALARFNLQAPILVIGKRTNVDFMRKTESLTWKNLITAAKTRGTLFTGYAEDYFITTRRFPWKDIAGVVIGRVAYDNWLVWYARKQNHLVVDATNTVLAIHQTTGAGNMEGHAHENGQYNENLLSKVYPRINYDAGSVECAEHYTRFDTNGMNVFFLRREIPKNCNLFFKNK